jgi:hypothetical protein
MPTPVGRHQRLCGLLLGSRDHSRNRCSAEPAELDRILNGDRQRVVRRGLDIEGVPKAGVPDKPPGPDNDGPESTRAVRFNDCLLGFHLLASSSGDAPRHETSESDLRCVAQYANETADYSRTRMNVLLYSRTALGLRFVEIGHVIMLASRDAEVYLGEVYLGYFAERKTPL